MKCFILAASVAVASAQMGTPTAPGAPMTVAPVAGRLNPYGLMGGRGLVRPVNVGPRASPYGLAPQQYAPQQYRAPQQYAPQQYRAPQQFYAPQQYYAPAPVQREVIVEKVVEVAPKNPRDAIKGLDAMIMYNLLKGEKTEFEEDGAGGVKKVDDNIMMMMMMSGVGNSGASGMNNYLMYSLLDDKDDSQKYTVCDVGCVPDKTIAGVNYMKTSSNKNNMMMMLFGGIGGDMGGIGQDAMLPLLLSGSGTDGNDNTKMMMLMAQMNSGLF